MEVSPVPSPFPGTSGEGPLFFDDFAYPNGPLTGQGPWVAESDGSPSMTVSTHTATAPEDGGIYGNEAALPASFTTPWSMEWDATFSWDGGSGSEVFAWIGLLSTHQAGMDVTIGTGDAFVSIIVDNNLFGSVNVPWALGATRECKLTYDGTTLRAYIDDVLVTSHVTSMALMPPNIGAYIVNSAGMTTPNKIDYIQFTQGI